MSNFILISNLLRYGCGNYAEFVRELPDGTEELYTEASVTCQWNGTWTTNQLDSCRCEFKSINGIFSPFNKKS